MPFQAGPLGRLFGRTDEVELVVALLDGVVDVGGALVVRGEPGIGKSRLLLEGAELAHSVDMILAGATLIVYLDRENGRNEMAARLEQIMASRGLTDEQRARSGGRSGTTSSR